MSTMIVPAVFYTLFALSFLVLMLMMKPEVSAEMYEAAVERFQTTPWSQIPRRTIHDVRGGPDVYMWLREVFVNELFRDFPADGLSSMYCTPESPCVLGEGHVMKDTDCAAFLVKGTRNCASYMGSDTDCCEPCLDSDHKTCPFFNISSQSYKVANTTSVDDLSSNCADPMPPWLEELSGWQMEQDPSWEEASTTTSNSPPRSFTFCPERVPKVQVDMETMESRKQRFLMIADYNRVLMARLSLKRFQLVDSSSTSYANAYPKVMRSRFASASTDDPGAESRETFGDTEQFQYQEGGGYYAAGAFVDYIDFTDTSKDEVLRSIARLEENYWFDLNQASFVLEMVLFNGNVDKFLYVSFVFEHGFSGQTSVTLRASALELTLHDPSRPESYVRFILYLLIIGLFIYFLKNEFDDMSADVVAYFSNFMALLHMTSLVLCAVSIILYIRVALNYDYLMFELPLPRDFQMRVAEFESLVTLSDSMATFSYVIGWNSCLIYIRLISLLIGLAPDSGIVFNTITQVRFHLLGFLAMFVILTVAFCLGGYFLLGAGSWLFSTWTGSFMTTTRAILRESHYHQIMEACPELGFMFFFSFHLTFLIARQPMLSMIIHGYFLEKERMKQLSDTDRYPMKRFWRQLQVWIRNNSSFLNRIAVSLNQILFGSGDGGSMRINYEQVSALRDGRATRPRLRSVRYELKGEDYGHSDGNDPAKDVTLRYSDPFYPNGMMQYYVEEVQPEGAAEENKVQKGFRLIGIQKSRGTIDYEKFRDYKRFHSLEERELDGYSKKTQNILSELQDSLPVTLEFEGGVKPTSKECIGLILFSIIFVVCGTLIARVPHSESLSAVVDNAAKNVRWYEHSPARVRTFDSLSSWDDAQIWVTKSLERGAYACSDTDTDCKRARDDWFLWTGENSVVGESRRSLGLPLTYTPAAANGMSIGYIPFVQPANPEKSTVKNDLSGRTLEYNVGVMPHNNVRMTFQTACYEAHPSSRFRKGYPTRLHPALSSSWGCSDDSCMKSLIEDDVTCLDADGNFKYQGGAFGLTGYQSGVEYRYSVEGSRAGLGGVVIGLGGSTQEARKVLRLVARDRVVNDAISVVFETVSYNGNVNLFTFTEIKFNLLSTGKFDKKIRSVVFPLAQFSLGKHSEQQTFNTIHMFAIIHLVFCILFSCYLIYDLFIQYNITKELQRAVYMFPIDFFTEDWWNFIDAASMIINVFVIVSLFKFYLVEATFNEFETFWPFYSWTLDRFRFLPSMGLEDKDPISQFQYAAALYEEFTMYLGFNGLLMMLRTIKYLGAFPQLRLIMTTMASTIYEVAIMTLVYSALDVGFVMIAMLRFGIVFFDQYGTASDSLAENFLGMLGNFRYTPIQKNDPLFSFFFFPVSNAVFYVLLTLYLAAMVYRWQITRRDAQEFALHTLTTRIYEALQPRKRHVEDTQNAMTSLDGSFWKKCGVLEQLSRIDEIGIIRAGASKQQLALKAAGLGAESGAAATDAGALAVSADAEADGLALNGEEANKQFFSIFRKAHMDIASQICKRPDTTFATAGAADGTATAAAGEALPGAGVGGLLDADADREGARSGAAASRDLAEDGDMADSDDGAPIELGIIEDQVLTGTASAIEARLARLLEESGHPAEEIWLDALVTVMEAAGTLTALQKFFLPMPMIQPKKVHEWGNFNQKKIKMERRLDLFLKMLQEETRIKYFFFLKDSASAKERVLKQQSLVLTDYLEQLDEQIGTLQDEIRVLERRSADMRMHIAPLL
eukprot:TRINITY_DN7618_c0_g2_i1.p1 TRINITY_DN7618_c0_g2~~TRINITY_DN7618_c0_g2_i1.p1  ORF type:complete len:1751 (-),score=274.06 TRINITY_DN7618_c0_g2_i1:106-5358(-)